MGLEEYKAPSDHKNWLRFAKTCRHRKIYSERPWELGSGGNPICRWGFVGMRCMFNGCPIKEPKGKL